MSPLRQSPLNEVPPKLYAKGDLFKRRVDGFCSIRVISHLERRRNDCSRR